MTDRPGQPRTDLRSAGLWTRSSEAPAGAPTPTSSDISQLAAVAARAMATMSDRQLVGSAVKPEPGGSDPP